MHLIFYFQGALFGLPKLFLSIYLFRAWTQDIIHRSLMSYGGILILRMNNSTLVRTHNTSICPNSFGLTMHLSVGIVLIITGSESTSHCPIKRIILIKYCPI